MQLAELILNLNELYKPPLNASQQTFYRKFLDKFTENQLEELWEITMETHMRMSPPTIGELNKYAKGVTKVKVVSQEYIEMIQRRKLSDEEIFSTRIGKLSLAQGWANSYHDRCINKGIPEQTDKVILDFQQAQHRAELGHKDVKENYYPFSRDMISLRETMIEKNQMWADKFQHLIDPALSITHH